MVPFVAAGELFYLPNGEPYRDMETMRASKDAAVFATKFEENLQETNKPEPIHSREEEKDVKAKNSYKTFTVENYKIWSSDQSS